MKIANKTKEYNKDIDFEEWHEALKYIYKRVIIFSSFIFFIVVLGTILNIPKSFYIFLMTYLLLRTQTGGFHLKNMYLCYILSILLPFGIYYIFSNVDIKHANLIGIFIISMMLSLSIGTVDNSNRRLEEIEKKRFKKNALIMYSILLVFISFYKCKYIVFASVINMISLLLGYLKNRKLKK